MSERHFVTGNFQSHAEFLPDDIYGLMLDNIVRGSTDIVPINRNGEILIGKRTHYPHPDWWIIGGKWNPGDSPEASAAKKFKGEMGVLIDLSRLQRLDCYSFVWSVRAAPPQEHGCHDISWIFIFFITDEEIQKITPNKEFSGIKWVQPEDIIADENYHPALRQIASDVRKITNSL